MENIAISSRSYLDPEGEVRINKGAAMVPKTAKISGSQPGSPVRLSIFSSPFFYTLAAWVALVCCPQARSTTPSLESIPHEFVLTVEEESRIISEVEGRYGISFVECREKRALDLLEKRFQNVFDLAQAERDRLRARLLEGKAANALQAAIERGDEKLTRSLLRDKGIHPAWRLHEPKGGKFHDVPVFLWAAQKASLAMVKVLVEAGADPARIRMSNPRYNALCFASILARSEMVDYLLSFPSMEKNIALAIVSLRRVRTVKWSAYSDVIHKLLKDGADPEARCDLCTAEKDSEPWTILDAADEWRRLLESSYKRGDKGVRIEDVSSQQEVLEILRKAVRDRR